MILRTDRLTLRPYSDRDFEAVHSYGCDPAVSRYMLWGPNNEEDTREFLRIAQEGANEEPRTKYDFAVELNSEGRMIGGCGIYLKGNTGRVAELGYVLHPAYHRRGIMPEGVRALIGFGFDSLGLHRIFARCHPENRPSSRVMEKVGMQYEGRLRDSEWVKGEWWDFLYYSILKHEQHGP
jgi:RimJ/RimL family protein N-acetyltransferase